MRFSRQLSTLLLIISVNVSAQVGRLGQNVHYMGEATAALSNADTAPFWFTANRYGLSSAEGNSGYLRAALSRSLDTDSLRKWKMGWAADVAVPVNHTSDFVVQQLYGEAEFYNVRLTVGAKQLDKEFINERLSTGPMADGINARPVPSLRLEAPDYFTVPGTRGWFGVKAHVAYGWFTDGRWQRDFVNDGEVYARNVLFHSKSLTLKLGNEEKFPLVATGGIEFASQFGGTAYNLQARGDDTSGQDLSKVHLSSGLKAYFNTMFMLGSDPNDGDFKNSGGNHLGSWHFNLKWHGDDWSVRGYFEHFFEDHSQLFIQYGWRDMTWGVEAELPKNPFVSTVVAEYLSTRDQTGGIYHDATQQLPVQLSGIDWYYNHHVYGAWQHWGQAMGNPLLLSPIYNDDGVLSFRHNRIQAYHIGLAGNPTQELAYRLLLTHEKSWGTYQLPLADTRSASYLLTELSYAPKSLPGWSATGAYGQNRGHLLQKSTGFMLTIKKTGLLK